MLLNRGLLRSQQGDSVAAAADLQAAIGLGDERALASAALADVFRKQGRPDEALREFSRAIARRPDWSALYRGRADVVLASLSTTPALRAEALSDLDQAIRLEKPDNAVVALDHTNRARLLALDGNLTAALAACEAAIARMPGREEAHRLRLDLLLKLKRHDDVIRSCDPIIVRGKASAAIYERRALARAETRDFPGAIADFTSALTAGADRPALLRRRGWLYIVADAPRLALADFQEATRLDPGNADAHAGRGLARLRLGEHREATADAQRAVSLGPPTSDLFYKAARVYAAAALVAAVDVRKQGQETALAVTRYQDRATQLLRECMRMLPAEQRASFVNDVILVDPELRTLRRRLSSTDLAGLLPPRSSPTATSGR